MSTCPCGLDRPQVACCGPVIGGAVVAATAEQLMRSRFTAFAVGDAAHLLATWHPRTRPPAVTLDPAQRWTRLEVLHATGGLFDREGTGEFRAHHVRRGRVDILHERSHFVREDGRWLYVGPAPAS